MTYVEQTKAQVHFRPHYDGYLPRKRYGTLTPAKIREMRKDPTISIARLLVVAPVLASEWSLESRHNEPLMAKDFINDVIMPLRINLLRSAFFGCIDFGWAPYEIVYEYSDGMTKVDKVKPLLQDFTDILVEIDTGAYAGLRQNIHGSEVTLDVPESLLLNIDVEGTYWYGSSLMEIAEGPYDKWNNVEAGADRYDQKLAGSHWVIHYPLGMSRVNGTDVDNFTVAKELLGTLEASGGIAVPRTVEETVDSLNKDAPDAWKIEILSDNSNARASFTDRQRYIDALKARAFGLPERSIQEGNYGTKAEAEAHADLALVNMELRHKIIVQQINKHLINRLLEQNWGRKAKNSVFIQPAPLTDVTLTYMRDIYKLLLGNPQTFFQEHGSIDLEALRDKLDIPTKMDGDVSLTPSETVSGMLAI